jgi:protein TonB
MLHIAALFLLAIEWPDAGFGQSAAQGVTTFNVAAAAVPAEPTKPSAPHASQVSKTEPPAPPPAAKVPLSVQPLLLPMAQTGSSMRPGAPANEPPVQSSAAAASDGTPSQASATASDTMPSGATASGNPNHASENYEALIHRWIEQHKGFPARLSTRGIRGTVTVSFELDRKGRIFAVRVQQSSGHRELDVLATQQLALAAPFPRAPHGADWRRRTFSVPMTYRPLG